MSKRGVGEGFWDDESNVEQLKTWWNEGLSAGEIAQKFGWRVSRNAVCGKLARLGNVETKPQRGGWRPKPKTEKTVKPVKLAPPPVEEPAPLIREDGQPVTLLTVHGGCRWPHWPFDGDPSRQFRVCGHPALPEHSYCSFHAAHSRGSGTRSERNATDAPKFKTWDSVA